MRRGIGARAALVLLAAAAPACAGGALEAPDDGAAERAYEAAVRAAPGSRAPDDGGAPEAAAEGGAGAAQEACGDDGDCGYDPASDRCGSDPRFNRQAPIVDQGIVCYCEAGACATLRVRPVPCERDRDCAVGADPRPHPVRATRERPHERGFPCRDFTLSTTCERTNICTLRRHACP